MVELDRKRERLSAHLDRFVSIPREQPPPGDLGQDARFRSRWCELCNQRAGSIDVVVRSGRVAAMPRRIRHSHLGFGSRPTVTEHDEPLRCHAQEVVAAPADYRERLAGPEQ